MKPYPLRDLIADLLDSAAALLVPGGRLVFWVPTMTAEGGEADGTDAGEQVLSLPTHPAFRLVAQSLQDFGRWGRRVRSLLEPPSAFGSPVSSSSPWSCCPKTRGHRHRSPSGCRSRPLRTCAAPQRRSRGACVPTKIRPTFATRCARPHRVALARADHSDSAVLPQHPSHRRRRHTISRHTIMQEMTRSSASARRVYEEACSSTMGARTAEAYRTERV